MISSINKSMILYFLCSTIFLSVNQNSFAQSTNNVDSTEKLSRQRLSGMSDKVLNLGSVNKYPYRMDFSFPKYEGVDNPEFMDLQVIHSGLVIVGNDYTMAARERAYESKKKSLDKIKNQKKNSYVKYKKYFPIFWKAFLDKYNEFEKLDDIKFFSITSPNDSDYKKAKYPKKITRYCNSRGNFRDFHIGRQKECSYGNYLGNFSYLFLDKPMKSGGVYSITQADGRKVTFVFDEDYTISRAIKINQTGYLPSISRKYAYIGSWQAGMGPIDLSAWENKSFQVVDVNSRKTVYEGIIKLLVKNPDTFFNNTISKSAGENIYEMDLSGLKTEGEFYIRVKGLGRSWPFYHHQEAYGRAFYTNLRGLFHLRGGQELNKKYTACPRPMAHGSAYICDYVPETPFNKTPENAMGVIRSHQDNGAKDVEWGPKGKGGIGGWYDAADYDRRWFHYHTFLDLILAYELAPKNFTDGQENTYESKNGIPDILDEAAWGLLVWRNSQRKNGGVSSRLEAAKHPDSKSMQPNGRPQNDKMKYYLSSPTREGSLRYAGAAAHLARLIKPFNADIAKGWLDSAKRAYLFGAIVTNNYKRKNYGGTGQSFSESETLIDISFCTSSLELYKATGKEAYLNKAIALYPAMESKLNWPLKYVRAHYWFAFYKDDAIPAVIKNRAKAFYLNKSDQLERLTHRKTYRSPIDPKDPYGTYWGKATGTYQARYLLMAWGLTHDKKFLDAAAISADWLQGCNPLGASWTSGIGYNYPWCFFSGEAEEDDILDPVPGMTLYGVTGQIPDGVKLDGFNLEHKNGRSYVIDKLLLPNSYMKLEGEAKTPSIPYWRRFVQDYHDNPPMQEYSVWETISPTVLVYGVLMGEGWMPSDKLKNMQPRDEKYLFGLWMTP